MIPYEWLEQAESRIAPYIQRTPLTYDAARYLYIKWENHQVTGSFKARGAFNKVLLLEDWERKVGLVAASAGNHGLRPVEQLLHPGALERGHARQRQRHDLLEVIPVRVQQAEVKPGWNAFLSPGNGVGFVAAHHQSPDFLLVVGEPVGITQRR